MLLARLTFDTSNTSANSRSRTEPAAAYVNGQIPFLTLVEAERSVVGLRDRYYELVADYYRRLATLERVVITSGEQATRSESGAWHVPKKELVACLRALLHCRRLQVAALPERPLLLEELQLFRVKLTPAAHETFEAWREKDHDDLVLAVALAVWYGSYGQRELRAENVSC